MNMSDVKYDEKGLVPAIVQDARSKTVLTLAYMSEESLKETLRKEETVFYSRSREELWYKGQTSGNTQRVTSIHYDCDQDALLVQVIPAGPACHKGDYSCFSEELTNTGVEPKEERYQILDTLQTILAERKASLPEDSYTGQLFAEGIDRIAKKIGEEAGEVIIAAKNDDPKELAMESADLLFHLMMVLTDCGVPLDEVLKVLEQRHS
ncbi:bifunctional phosphoribosyl-AMP cyclohydrolase/phosphoribosyl-ATP diphosphatase HisIE [Halobacillus sp. ACCC02827]|uniref:bifunctional phosphoribosyl-AMP cyclohydrolase/phosphoribosyl-ATP diphosphatase HisIE n=1 Tax=Bacillaceae TaxID=186817 RepID=UPI0002A5186B|nr:MULTISPECIES: bifunctional phosphoribosyl-AMP cyclohydrolase/phosphoribosyl-ATP diphosphatase HisIE [Bacillaceae]ELK47977.1 bifunctional phosphoribosyl-AMP cyclohydrolase/phosphoribosyl-ATP pyrophosphatase protein [Halobacillus sp. BAB-2008]QHT47611.1 bifunctional phosphoribosyl-AMP cyclohydrolase/phosphoribosyl-ATP diphosphatase HisIE [Bacillus sp. SB49]WJE14845.1 bifunctional phosphoribosyl-AMP cyclohydrolase/phosphoribosyl-ATP diphosphatase HisIE [Halobacillus sp. ACCC02827]